MRKYIKWFSVTILLVLLLIVLTGCVNKEEQTKGKFQIVTSFYPIHMMTLNLTQGTENVEVSSLTTQNIGCIHDYTLTTSDLKKLDKANVFIENGLGLENFIDKVSSTYKKMNIIDASREIKNTIKEKEELNGHVWTSISLYMTQVKSISTELQRLNPENKEIYSKNEQVYLEKLSALKNEYEQALQLLNGKGAIILNESFSYLARDAKLESIVLSTNHEESTLSAEKLKETIELMKEKNIKSIIIDKNDDTKNAETLKKETGANIYKLDSVLTGSLDKESYLNAMRGNLEILKQME